MSVSTLSKIRHDRLGADSDSSPELIPPRFSWLLGVMAGGLFLIVMLLFGLLLHQMGAY